MIRGYLRPVSRPAARLARSVALPLLVAALVAAPAPAEECAAERSYFAINGSKLFHVPEPNNPQIRQRLDWMRELGVKWDRNDLWWHIVEPQRGEFDFSRPDLVFDTFEARGINFYPILCYGAAWFTNDRTALVSDQDFQDFLNYAAKTVARYKGRARFWEVWNEPNLYEFWHPDPSAAQYAKLLKAVYPVIKAADPNALVCAPGVAPLGWWDRKFVETMYQHGAADSFDVFDYHYYRNQPPEPEVPAEIAEIIAVMHHYDRRKFLQISETGVSAIWEGKPHRQARQAAMVVRNQLLSLASGVDRIYYFDLQNWNDDTPHDWASQLGLVTAAGEPKKAFYAYKTLISEIDCKPIVGMCSGLGDDVYGVLVFDADADAYILAIWTGGENLEREVALAVADEAIEIVDPYGQRRRVMAEAGVETPKLKFKFKADRHPRFVHGVDPLTYLPLAGVRFERALTLLAPGQATKLALHVDERLTKPEMGELKVRAADGVAWNFPDQTLRCASDAKPGEYEVEIKVELQHGPADDRRTAPLTLKTRVEVLPTVAVLPRLFMKDGQLMLHAALVNHAKGMQKETLRLIGDGKQKLATRGPLALSPRETQHIALKIPRAAYAELAGVVDLHLTFGEQRSRPLRFYPARRGATAIEIDGKLDDWVDASAIEINAAGQVFAGEQTWSAADASATCHAAFGDEMLYVAALIRDDDPMHNDQPKHALWKGDALEVFLGRHGPTKRSLSVEHEEIHLAIAPRSEGGLPLVFRHRPDKLISDATVAATTTRDGYVLEAAIPLSAIDFEAAPTAGAVLGFDITLNDGDADAPAPTHRAAWSGTERNWIDPSEHGVMTLVE